MNYEQYFDTSVMFEMKQLHGLEYSVSFNNEFILAFNPTCTNMLIIKQPYIINRQSAVVDEDTESAMNSSMESIEFNL